jgi:SAM-dependent methyltransferase
MAMSDRHTARTWVNADQAAGEHRIRHVDLFDAEVRPHNERFRAAARVGPRDRVLDIGCGTGQSTREAAGAAIDGSVLGVDLSAQALETARRLSEEEGLRNVTYLQADAQVHHFPPAQFDLCISRFGAMFFADPVAAFTNIGRALRPAARLVLLVWQDHDRNEWSTAIHQALVAGTAAPAPPAGGQEAFSLGDPAVAEGTLTAAGFAEVNFAEVHEPVYYGPDLATARELILGLRAARDVLANLDATTAEHALGRLSASLASHDTGNGVFFDSRAWIITAHHS